MSREEKRRKFHEAVLSTLYPPPPSPPPQAEDQDEKPVNTTGEDFDVELVNPDDYLSSSTSANDDDDDDDGEGSECVPEKLTRAQRKRLRKKKLKEDATRRRNIIGPLLPTTSDGDYYGRSSGGETDSPGVRQNASKGCAVPSYESPPGELTGCCNQKKVKHRRMAKRLAREQLKLSNSENNREDQSFESSHENDSRGQDKKRVAP